MRIALRTSVIALLAMGLAGCQVLQEMNYFTAIFPKAEESDGPAPEEKQRIPLLALDQQLRINDALKGGTFTLPPAMARADSPLPGGSLEQAPEHIEAAPEFKIAWRSRIGRGSSRIQHVTAPPLVVAGRVYTMDAGATVTVTDAATGKQIWREDFVPKTLQDGTRPATLLPPIFAGNTPVDTLTFGGGIAYADGKLFIASGYRFVAAVDAATGELLWRSFTASPIHGAPTVSGGRVFAISVDNELQTFDVATGTPGWSHQGLVEPVRILQASSPAISGDAVVAAFSSGEVTALRAVNGNELWPANLTRVSRTTALSDIRDIPGRPVIYRGDVYAGSHSGVFAAIDFRTGSVRWEMPVITTATPWPAGDVVYIVSKAGEVICARRDNGQVYWIRDLNEGRVNEKVGIWGVPDKRAYYTGVILASNRLITVTSDGKAIALNPISGEVLGTLKLPGPALITPVAAGGTVYVVTDNGVLVAIR